MQKIKDILAKQPDITLAELADSLNNIVSATTLHVVLKNAGYVYKKTLKASEQDRKDIKMAREAWRQMQKTLPMHRIVCIDESAAKTNMTRMYGRAPAGQRLPERYPRLPADPVRSVCRSALQSPLSGSYLPVSY